MTAGPLGIHLTGSLQLKKLSAELKTADKQLRRDMGKEIRKATKPLVVELQNSAFETLPRRGYLGLDVSRTPIRTSILSGPRSAGIRLRAAGKAPVRDVAASNQGRIRHPLFGNRNYWFTQSVKPGWWDRPTQDPALNIEVSRGIQRALDETFRRLKKR